MPADITIPWIDPLKLVDAYARIVLKPDMPSFMLYAPVLAPDGMMHHAILKGESRVNWIARFAPEESDQDLIVSFAPQLNGNSDRLAWRPLYLKDLRRWADQLQALRLDPLGDNLPVLAEQHRQLQANGGPQNTSTREEQRLYPHTYPTVAMHRVHRVLFMRLLDALRHPDSAPIPASLSPDGMASLIRPDLTNDDHFLPMCNIARDGSVLRVCHGRNYGAPGRSGWRRVQHHGLRPDTLFYGKQWIAQMTAPDALFAGVEMEMELQNSSQRQRMLVALFSSADEMGTVRGQERLHVEQDGSIAGHGVEVVLMPHEIHSYHGEMFWRRMWQTAIAGGASNGQRTCGMHVHISAKPALQMPRGTDPLWPGRHKPTDQDYMDTTGLLIDLVTAMLIGGSDLNAFALIEAQADRDDASTMFMQPGMLIPVPTSLSGSDGNARQRYGGSEAENPTSERFVTEVFGRPAQWSGDYAGTQFHLMRKRPHTQIDRYRQVNWNNHHTIEFRTFGPHDYNENVDDWVNVATQMCSAIVHFCRANALHVLRKGCQAADMGLGASQVLALMPRWLQPMLMLRDVVPPTDRERDASMFDAMGAPKINGRRYALSPPVNPVFGSGVPHPWLPGLPWAEARHAWGTYVYDRTWPSTYLGGGALRASTIHGAILLLWQRFRTFLERQSPQYAILQAHLQQRVYPKLPTQEQQAMMLHRHEPVVRQPLPQQFNEPSVDAAIAALGLEGGMTTTTGSTISSWSTAATLTTTAGGSANWADARENLRHVQRPSTST